MKYRTKEEIKMPFGKGTLSYDITIPKGTRCSDAGKGEFFVEDISFLDRNSIVWHDANYYGIRLAADKVEEVSS